MNPASFIILCLILYSFDFALIVPFSLPGVGSLSVGKIGLTVSSLLILLLSIGRREALINKKIVLLLSPFVIWFLYIALSSLWSLNQNGAGRYIALTGFNLLALLIASKVGQNSRYAIYIISSVIAISIAFALADFIFGYRPNISRQYSFTNEVVGIFPNSISLGFTLASILPGVLVYIINRGVSGFSLTTTALLSILIIFLTGSRSSLISSALSTGIMYFTHRTQRHPRTVFVLLAVTIVGLTFGERVYNSVLPTPIVAKISTIPQLLSKDGGFDATARGQAIQFGLDYFRHSPLIGYGSASVEYIFQNIPELAIESNINAHNWWLENAINGGVIALVLFTLGYVNTLTNIVPLFRRDSSLLNCILAGYIIAFPLLVFGPGSITNLPFPWIILGLVLGRIADTSVKNDMYFSRALEAQ